MKQQVRALTEGAVMIALAEILSFLPLYKLPWGGSIDLAMLPVIRKFVTPKQVKTNVDSVVGSMGYVTEQIDNLNATGQVKLGGMYWTARSEDHQVIPVGTLVEVDHIEGVKAFVTAVPMEEEVEV